MRFAQNALQAPRASIQKMAAVGGIRTLARSPWIFCLLSLACLCFCDTLSDMLANAGLFAGSLVFGSVMERKIARADSDRGSLAHCVARLEGERRELQSAVEQGNEMLAFASHQLRSPLTAIAGYAAMAEEGSLGPLSPKQREVAAYVSRATAHLSEMVEDFLAAARAEDASALRSEQFDLFEEVSDAADEARDLAAAKNLGFIFSTDGKVRYLVDGDRGLLRQAIQNLMGNAVKYTKSGVVRVRLSRNANTRRIVIAVEDTGIGIVGEEAGVVFQKWKRGRNGIQAAGGSGLGLYLAKKTVLAHGGNIGCSSRGPGKGSRFYISLPGA